MAIAAGTRFDRYEILSLLGAGGMGEVYLARDTRLDRQVALKLLPAQFTQDADRVRRFVQEAKAASALNHPNIITIYEIGQTEAGLHYIAAEFIEGQTLRERMQAGQVELREAVEIAAQVASALQAAHAAGIAHRDIKPENIMLRPDGYIKVLDFGLAKLTEQTASASDLDGPTKSLFETMPGVVMGTIAYMSPEQARGLKVDGRTDIFSLGVVLYEMISGRRPFAGATTSDTIAALLVSEPSRLPQHLPAELEQVVNRMLAKEREARYQSVRELLAALKPIKARLELGAETEQTKPLDSAAWPPAGSSVETSYETNIGPPSFETTRAPAAGIARPETARAAAQMEAPRSKRRRYLLTVLGGLALLLAALAIVSFLRDRGAIDSIAVLPFANVTAHSDAEYLSDGITEGIINSLSQLPELSVISRNSVVRYKGRETDAQAVGRELEVKAVLLGRITQRGDDLAINVELVDVRNRRQIWGERFNRKLADLIAVQEEITREISNHLRLRLSSEAQQLLARRGTQDAEAYQLYLKGRYYWNQGTPEAMKQADAYFEQAAARDPSYALAAAGCAACHAAGSDRLPPSESMPKAKLVALKALKADDALAEAHLTLAQVNLRYDWDFTTAEREFKRAIELNLKNATARHRYAEFLTLMGRPQEAMAELNRARELDPHSLPINQAFGTFFYYAQQYDQAIERLRKTLDLDPNFAPAHADLGLAYEQSGQQQEAIVQFLRAKTLMRADREQLAALKQAYATAGPEGFWRKELEQLSAAAKKHYIPASTFAALHTRLGDHSQALIWLEKGLAERDGGMVELKVMPVFNSLRSDARFAALLRRVGLQQ